MSGTIPSVETGWGIQVVVPGPDHTFTLNEEALSALLLREDVRDRAAVVVSVAGAFRKGKSFLLDFFLRYLQHKYGSSDYKVEWLGVADEPLKGFKWRGGSDRETTGLLLWSHPFKVTQPNGEELVVFLMDTQGTFDSESTVKDNATVFALSTMISSVQIYNLSQNIEEDDLQHLQLFTDYGRLAKEKSIGKPFQKLQFLIRDWNYPYEYPYGAKGGEQYLAKILQIEERQHEELRNLRTYITSTFDEISCFLMPHPGMTVATHREFNGKLADISEEFKEELKKLVPMVLAPENLVPKLIEGQKVKAKDLLHIFKAYMKVFSGDELPEPKSILEATAEANNLSACAEAQDVYKTLMEEVCGGTRPYIQPLQLEQEHTRILNKALHAFENKKKMGGEARAATYKNKLEAELEELYEQYKAHNEGKNLYKMFRTPAVFLMMAVVVFLFSVVADMLGIQSLETLLQMMSLASLAMAAVWLYVKLTGTMREIGTSLDEFADGVLDWLRAQALGPHGNRTHVQNNTSTDNSGEDKKHS